MRPGPFFFLFMCVIQTFIHADNLFCVIESQDMIKVLTCVYGSSLKLADHSVLNWSYCNLAGHNIGIDR